MACFLRFPSADFHERLEAIVFQLVLVLLLFAMVAGGVTLTGIGGVVADVAQIALIVTLAFTIAAIAVARRRTSGSDRSPWDQANIPRWGPTHSGTEYQMEDEASGSLPSIRERRRT
jgi:hypothetical protein